MKSYVINLERAVDRREATIKQFDHHGIEFELFSGVDWLDLTDDDVATNVDSKFLSKLKKKYGPTTVLGMLACWLSHRNLWKIATANNEGTEIFAIFEDDACLTKDTKSALKAITTLDQQNFGFDIIFLYDSKRIKPLIPIYNIDENFSLNLVKYSSMGAVGYVISRQAIDILLKNYPLMNMGVDELMHYYWLTGLKTYVLNPQIVFHGDVNPSVVHYSYAGEVDGTNEVRTMKYVNPKLYKWHKIKGQITKLYGFPSRLIFKYIPQRLAFRKRMKYESL